MPDTILIAPISLPILGALALLVLGNGRPDRRWDPLPMLVAATVLAASLLLPESASAQIDLTAWVPPRILPSQPVLRIDRFALSFIWALALAGVAATGVGGDAPARDWAVSLLLWGGCLGMIMAGSMQTLASAWLVGDLALFLAALRARRPTLAVYRLLINGVGAAILMAIGLATMEHSDSGLSTGLSALSPGWLGMFFLAGAIRMGLYPFHVVAFRETDGALPPMVLARIAGALTGSYLWFRVLMTTGAAPQWLPYLVVIGGIGALASTLLAWSTWDARRLIPWFIIYELSIVAVDLGLDSPRTSLLAALELANLVLAIGLLGLTFWLGQRTTGRWARRWVRGVSFVSMAALLGLPPTPGFVARWGLYRYAVESGILALILPVVVAGGLLVPPALALLRRIEEPASASPPGMAIAGSAFLGIPLLLTSAQPLLLAPLLDPLSGRPSYPAMASLIRGAGSGSGAQIIALILVPALLGYSLDRVYESSASGPWWRSVGKVLALEWLCDFHA